ncbi:hypothetical protein [Devosia sp.]|uniref:hypothetical protein n=1 Tax=Devosia sp. TaxID=1871048 RepID=UPI003263A45B
MRLVFAVAVLAALSATPAMALMAPQYERLAELEAILNDGRIVEAFGFANPIDKLEYVGKDLYRVTGGSCHIDVTLADANTAHEAGWAGPREFVLQPGKLICN